ncbi:PQQ-dependent sugar dehydrogenase [Saccharopolyspora griseoalba]|uniref:PQQ-dependent sugar dehydrogenase n=1 Tax=Saccharopolyspora griseoalba TaxID=1431848 RepID=A0ABW2LF86_9PSEU
MGRSGSLRLGALVALGALLAGCAQFPDEHTRPWSAQPSLTPQAGPQPEIEGSMPTPGSEAPQPPGPAQVVGCQDPSPSVVATCLNPIGAVAVLPDGQSALVGERTTGRVLRVRQGSEPVEVARIPVDPAGGGGLTGLALSPSYAEDELFYAYASTGGENQVVRIAAGDRPKPVLSGIPHGPSGNAGALIDDGKGALLVATGNAGDPAKAADPHSLAGKVLRIDGFGAPAEGNPTTGSAVVSSGLADPSGMCGTPGLGTFWVTDRNGGQDALYRMRPGEPLGEPAWTWPDSPGVSGCAADPGTVVVSLREAAALYTLHPAADGTFTGQPSKVMENSFGRFSAATLAPDGLVWLGTSNKDGGSPISSDDRVLRIEPPTGGSAGKD